MDKNNISIKDVAMLAGVSPTTVSRVLNNSNHPVNSKTKEKVLSAIKELNFQPNRMARGLINNKSHIVGVIVHDISDPYFSEIVKGIEEIVFDYGYIVNIYNTCRNIDKELSSVDMLIANRADAVVFTGSTFRTQEYITEMEKLVDNLRSIGSVVVGVATNPFNVKKIKIDNTYDANIISSYRITNYLINRGHKKLAFINGPNILSTANERLTGFKKALKDNSIEYIDKYILEGDFTFEGGRSTALKILNIINDITAVVCANDETALGLLWELKNQGYSVPEDISVTGIGNIPPAKYSYPSLTTVSFPVYNIGLLIGRYIIQVLENIDVDIETQTNLRLVERGSVKKI